MIFPRYSPKRAANPPSAGTRNAVTLVTALLTSGVGDLLSVIGPLLQEEVVALCQAKPPKKVTMEMACLTNQ